LLESSWSGEVIIRAAEILRYLYPGFSPTNVTQFTKMLTNVYLPKCWIVWSQANWLTSRTECSLNIAVFTENRTLYNEELVHWRNWTVSLSYLTTDGPLSTKYIMLWPERQYINKDLPTAWYHPILLPDGLWQETCRDMSHALMGIAAAMNAAETFFVQGDSVYDEIASRMTSFYELHANWLSQYLKPTNLTNWACPTPLNLAGTGYKSGWEIAYNHYACRRGKQMPKSKIFISEQRPSGVGLHMVYETLSHGCDLDSHSSVILSL